MEKWEHMTLNVRKIEHSGQVEVRTIAGPDYVARQVDVTDAPETPAVWMLDQLGSDGWELVSVTQLEDGGTFYLKRSAPSNPESPQVPRQGR